MAWKLDESVLVSQIIHEILIQDELSLASWWLGLVVVVQGSRVLLCPVPVSQA